MKKNNNEMKYITVLDFDKGVVFRYETINNGDYQKGVYNTKNYDSAFVWNPDKERLHDYLTRMQHNINNCQWMVHDHSEVSAFVRKVYWD